MARKIKYDARNFADIRTELINFVKQYYPDLFQDFNDASVGTMLIELNAAVGDMLSYNTDRMFNETQIDYAQEKRSVLAMARTLGLKIPNKRPSITLADFSVEVPVRGDTWDIRYAPILRYGAQAIGAGQTFETLEDIDFSSAYSSGGVPNRLILPNIDANQNIINYTIVKREIVVQGVTREFKKTISDSDFIPFLQVILPDSNIISIENTITKEGNTATLEDYTNSDLKWYEMDSLAEDKVFIQDDTRNSDNSGIVPGKWVSTTKRFIKEFTDNGFCKITFGSGTADEDLLSNFSNNSFVLKIGDFINTTALGEIPTVGETLFIRYRTGGGTAGNVGANVFTSPGVFTMYNSGTNATIVKNVRKSLKVSNSFPAFGGKDAPSIEEVRQMTKYNFASQNRAVTIKDYYSTIFKMGGKFGIPFRMGVSESQNKVEVVTIGLDANGKLSNQSTNTLKENIASFLSDYRMINDYVTIRDGKIIDLAFDIDVFVDKAFNEGEIVNNVIDNVKKYFNVHDWEMGDNIYMAQLLENINNVGGVLNVIEIKVYNKVGGGNYSLNKISQPYLDVETRQIDLTDDFALFGEYDTPILNGIPNFPPILKIVE